MEDGDVLRCDVMADECDRFVDDSESISRGLVRTVVVWSVRGSVCSFTSLSLSFTLTPLRLSHWYFSILSPFAVNLYYYTHRIIIMSHTHTHRHKIYDFIYIYIYAVVVVAARVCFYRPLRNINNNNNNDTYICVKHILYIISVCVWGVPWRDVLPPP